MRTTVKSIVYAVVLLMFSLSAFCQQVAKTIPNSTSPDGRIGFLEFKPSDYGTQNHPLIIFLHGIGERGNGTTQINNVTANAIPKFCSRGATMRFTVAGQTSSFVVLSPQLSTSYGYWPTFYVKEMIKYAKANLQIDPNRIYITGLSLGGGGIWGNITDGYEPGFDAGIAAAAPVCGTQQEDDAMFCSTIGVNNLPIWAFHSMDDGTVNVGATQHAEILAKNCGLNPAAKFTYYQTGGHGGAWINAYDTGHITKTINVNGVLSSFTANPNLYEWFLSNTRSITTPAYTAPAASAGTAQTITLPVNTVTLTGNGAGTNGATIASYAWTKTSGPAGAVIVSAGASTTSVTGLLQGTYVFTFTVTDNHALSTSATVTITVNAATTTTLVNQLPVSVAGADAAISLPSNSVVLDGSGSYDSDGNIVEYYWSQSSGPSTASIANQFSVATNVGGLVQGTYKFLLQTKDNAGGMGYSLKTVTVNTTTVAAINQKPVSNAGADAVITFPANSIELNGVASYDPDGTIVEHYWSQASGPSTATIGNNFAVSTNATNLVAGVYVFVLQAKDNNAAMGYSTKTVTVNTQVTSLVNQAPVSNAGADATITLPTNSIALNGSASQDADGTIVEFYWSQASGPAAASIGNNFSVSTTASNLVKGVYVFVLQAKDNTGTMGYSTKTVTVNTESTPTGNQSPVSNAGADITVKFSVNNVSLDGSASYDPDGTIIEYYWAQASGPSTSSIANSFAMSTTVSNIVKGEYVFVLQTKDDKGGMGYSQKKVTVTASGSSSASAAATAGQPVGYIKMSTGPYQACDDASSTERIAIYSAGIANGGLVYSDAAMTTVYDGGWNWFSFTPVLGGATTYAFAIYPNGAIALLRDCLTGTNLRTINGSNSAEADIAALNRMKDSAAASLLTATTVKLKLYPNPVHTAATVEITSTDNSMKMVNLYNANGALKAKYIWATVTGKNQFSLKDIASLANGFYVLEVADKNGKRIAVQKFLKM